MCENTNFKVGVKYYRMKKISYLLFVFIIVAAYFSEGNFFIKQVHAATTTFSGMLTGDGPKFKRPEFPHDFRVCQVFCVNSFKRFNACRG